MVNGKGFYFWMSERESFIFLVMVGMRFTWYPQWVPTHLVTQFSSFRFTWSSLLPASIEYLALSLQCVVHWARQSWNFSSSLVIMPWACARGMWQGSVHRCTCCMIASQQPALHQNMRPCIFCIVSLSPGFSPWSPLPPSPKAAAGPPWAPHGAPFHNGAHIDSAPKH